MVQSTNGYMDSNLRKKIKKKLQRASIFMLELKLPYWGSAAENPKIHIHYDPNIN